MGGGSVARLRFTNNKWKWASFSHAKEVHVSVNLDKDVLCCLDLPKGDAERLL